jgi:hypothetical protein
MNDNKQLKSDSEHTLITLDQLSQTIEVMTSVVNRLRQHLSEQLKAQIEEQKILEKEEALSSKADVKTSPDGTEKPLSKSSSEKKESFVIEISQHESDPVRKNDKSLH